MSFINWGNESPEQLRLRKRLEEQMLLEQAMQNAATAAATAGVGSGGSATSGGFTCTVDTQANLEMYFSFISTGEPIEFTIDWGDGTIHVDDGLGGFYSESHTYSDPAIYTIKVTFDKPSQVLELNFPGFDDGYASLTSISGLQKLVNLDEFRADYNSLQTIDFSGLTNLTYVDISDCTISVDGGGPHSLTSVNLTGCASLEELRVDDSDFSGGIPDLTGLDNLQWVDMDDSDITGTVDLSMFPSLEGFDLSSNSGITNVIISSSQPLGNRSVDIAGTALTQVAVDAILVALSTNGVTGGYVNLSGGTSAVPSSTGLAAKTVLEGNGWNVNVNNPPAPRVTIAPSADFDITGDFTIEAFFSDRSGEAGTSFSRLYSFGIHPAANAISIEPGGVYFWANNTLALYSNFSPIIDQWHHICIIGSGDTLYMLIDGVQVASSPYIGSISSQGFPLTIGYGNGANTEFNGFISNFRWSDTAQYSSGGFIPPTSPFVVPAAPTVKLQILQGSTGIELLNDNSGNGNIGFVSGNVSVSNDDPFGSAESSLQFGT